MRPLHCAFLSLIAATLLSVPASAQAPPPVATTPALPQLVLTGGTVIDVTNWGNSARDLPNAVVIIRDGMVSEVGPSGEVQIPKGSRILDCTGKFLIPGLIDGFAGMNSQAEANANLYMGVTTVVARADKERGFVDLGANPSPHLYLIDLVELYFHCLATPQRTTQQECE